jgi:hypothetical protein
LRFRHRLTLTDRKFDTIRADVKREITAWGRIKSRGGYTTNSKYGEKK